ncbi:LD-carboxypeptidase [Mixta theicola]|uniref:LD-carboxypeptidase n=1 Tax=Mixta theicola TaxID=1458355 RepID=A0A2K1QD97_9GAMM|nr:LD-carboxypeptidase [Mixta theicola]PNS12987.1 LD-carboxypeptidase [Mixta theicola]GLR09244.1 peptidase U61 [Mixta theicola]
MSYSFIILLMLSTLIADSSSLITLAEDTLSEHVEARDDTAAKTKIYLISSSSQYDESVISKIRQVFTQQGYLIDTTYLNQKPTPLGYVNTDENRAQTLIQALTDDNVKYLWFVRGGSGALNLYPWLYASQHQISASSPKILIGFSDVTAIHHYINNDIQWPSVHGVLASHNQEMHELNRLEKVGVYNSIQQVFQAIQEGVTYTAIEPMNRPAFEGAQGILNGGNMTLVQSLFSTRYETDYSDKVVILEDVDVTSRQLDRTLHQFEYSKTFLPKAVIFGQFYRINATLNEKELYRDVIQAFAERVDYPVYYYPAFGHGMTNQPFMLAQQINIECGDDYLYCSLTQPPLSF